jgi:hypothetical protein
MEAPGGTLLLDTQSPLLDQISLRDGRPASWQLVSPGSASAAPALHAAMQMAIELFAGRATPLAEFRRDSLAAGDALGRHRRAIDVLLACAAVLLIALTGAFLLRAHRYADRAGTVEEELKAEFSNAFPNWPVPANVRSVLASEHRKALAQSPAVSAAASGSALDTLQSVIRSLPRELRLQLTRIDATDTSIDIDGRVRALESLDALSASLRSAGLEPAPPQARKDSTSSWSFTLRAARAPSAALTSAKEAN